LTFDLTVSVARTLAKLNPTTTFIYVSGAGTDSTERGSHHSVECAIPCRVRANTMKGLNVSWAKQVDSLERHLQQRVFRSAFYPCPHQSPFYPVLKRLFPNSVTTTECVGHAMLKVTKQGFPKPVLENRDINVMCAKDTK
jgi:hypothetical protein